MRSRPLVVLAAISFIEGAALAIYALLAIVNALVGGSFGPEAISNTSAITLEIVIFAVLGAGLIVTALGWWRVKRWARAPFILMQLIALVVGYPLIGSTGSAEKLAGAVIVVLAVVGIVLSFLPATTRALLESE